AILHCLRPRREEVLGPEGGLHRQNQGGPSRGQGLGNPRRTQGPAPTLWKTGVGEEAPVHPLGQEVLQGDRVHSGRRGQDSLCCRPSRLRRLLRSRHAARRRCPSPGR
ncbi:unnamed protein product, partial [Ectocarpus fasciculatus]